MGMVLRGMLHSTYYLLGSLHEPHQAYGHGGMKISEVSGVEEVCASGFQMPLHYPRYKKADYEKMEEWKVDLLLKQYGLNFHGSLDEKRAFAMGAFLWPDQY